MEQIIEQYGRAIIKRIPVLQESKETQVTISNIDLTLSSEMIRSIDEEESLLEDNSLRVTVRCHNGLGEPVQGTVIIKINLRPIEVILRDGEAEVIFSSVVPGIFYVVASIDGFTSPVRRFEVVI